MAVTQNTYTGDGTTTKYSITFEYLRESDVKVSLDGINTTAFTLANATTINLNTPPALNVAVRVYRSTDNEELESRFFAGSAIRASDLNKNFEQTLFSVQEVLNRFIDRTQATFGNAINMAGFKITNLGNGTDSTDAVNKSQLDATQTYNDSQLASSVTSATTQATNAATSASAAGVSAGQAAASANTASTQAGIAQSMSSAAAASAATAASEATAAAAFSVDPVFYGFKRAVVDGRTVMRVEYAAATDTTTAHDPFDFFYKNKVTSFVGSNGLLDSNGEPKMSYQTSGHVYIQLH